MTKRIKIIFTISTLLNLLLIGVIIGNLYSQHIKPHHLIIGEDKTQDLIREKMAMNRAYLPSEMQKMREQYELLKDIITAPEFDLAAYEALIPQIMESKNKMGKAKAEQMGKALQGLSQEERQKISKRFLKGMMGGSRKSFEHGPKHNTLK